MFAGERYCDLVPLAVLVDGVAPHARVRHSIEYHRIGIQRGQDQGIVVLSIPGWCNLIEIIRDNRSHNLRGLGATEA